MIFKLENSQIVINGKSVLEALAAVYIVRKMYKAICKPVIKHYTVTYVELKKSDKEQKSSKQKVESK